MAAEFAAMLFIEGGVASHKAAMFDAPGLLTLRG
jgi:hypothetical protein